MKCHAACTLWLAQSVNVSVGAACGCPSLSRAAVVVVDGARFPELPLAIVVPFFGKGVVDDFAEPTGGVEDAAAPGLPSVAFIVSEFPDVAAAGVLSFVVLGALEAPPAVDSS